MKTTTAFVSTPPPSSGGGSRTSSSSLVRRSSGGRSSSSRGGGPELVDVNNIDAAEVATPPISNRQLISPGSVPPQLTLPVATMLNEKLLSSSSQQGQRKANHSQQGTATPTSIFRVANGTTTAPSKDSSSTRTKTSTVQRSQPPPQQQRPRFSSPTATPIIMKRSLQAPTGYVIATTPSLSAAAVATSSSSVNIYPYENDDYYHYHHQQQQDSNGPAVPRSRNPPLRLPRALPEQSTLALTLSQSSSSCNWGDLSFSMIPGWTLTGSTSTSTSGESSLQTKTATTSSTKIDSSSNSTSSSTSLVQYSPPTWTIPFLVTACDLFKTGIPMKLLYHASIDLTRRRVVDHQQQNQPRAGRRRRRPSSWGWRNILSSRRFFSRDLTSSSTSSQDQTPSRGSESNKGIITAGGAVSTTGTIHAMGTTTTTTTSTLEVGGIPNYGQTCFLNAVLQSLASLEPFLVYLERIVQVREQQQQQHQQAAENAATEATTPTPPEDNLSNHVWNILLAINGCSTLRQQQSSSSSSHSGKMNRIIKGVVAAKNGKKQQQRVVVDPRPILRRIGETNSQFQCYCQSNRHFNEQQDAQELLQALLGVVIQDAHLDTTSSSLESSFTHCGVPPPPPPHSFVSSTTTTPTNDERYPPLDDHQQQQHKQLSQGLVGDYFYNQDPDNETLTTVLATATVATEATSGSSSPNPSTGLVDWSPTSSTVLESSAPNSPTITAETHGISMISSSRGDSVLSLASLLHRIDAKQRNQQRWLLEQKQQQQQQEAVTAVGSDSGGTTQQPVAKLELSTEQQPSSPDDPTHHPKEEKKQEEFEISIPFVASEEDLERQDDTTNAISTATTTNGTHCDSRNKRMDDSTLSSVGTLSTTTAAEMEDLEEQHHRYNDPPYQSLKPLPHQPEQYLQRHPRPPTSMQIMRSTMSSITPSPLSGWLGSTLRCCNCKHVRPIQNAPFLDIPVIPTSIPRYLARVGGGGGASNGNGGKATPASSPFPACTLEQCLLDFTSVERVQDVECRNCTIQKRLELLEDEAMLLQGAINSIVNKKNKKQGGDYGDKKNSNSKSLKDHPEVKCLQDDLAKIEMRLFTLKTLDPDGGEVDATLLRDNSVNDGELELLLDSSSKDPTEGNSPKKNSSSSFVRCDAKKCLLLTRCPSVLCCHVQRRYFDPSTNRMEKCAQFVEFPLVLDLAPYCAYGPRSSTTWAAGNSGKQDLQQQKQQTKTDGEGKGPNGSGSNNVLNREGEKKAGSMTYRLQSIIEHRGNAHGGHYICYRMDHLGEWFRISDSNVTRTSWQQVRSCQAYMLFYEAL